MFELADLHKQNAVIKVIGLGGAGGNAVEHMMEEVIDGVHFIVANTDAQALKKSSAPEIIQLGETLTKGLGAGANPEVGRRAAEEDRERIKQAIEGADMLFITAGMGGGTGTGAAPVVAQLAKEMDILTVAVVSRPFSFEGKVRAQVAEAGIADLNQYVDSLITIPNNKLLSVLGKNVTLLNAFKSANNVLHGAVQGIANLITCPGLINVDFADVRTVMAEMGMAMMGTGLAQGESRARKAAEAAIASPLLEDVDLTGARGILVNITAGPDLSIGEFEEVGESIKAFTSENATVVIGTVIDNDMRDEVRVTVVVTGLGNQASTESLTATYQAAPTTSNTDREYQHLERPAYLRQPSPASKPSGSVVAPKPMSATVASQASVVENKPRASDMDYLDVPAFLRCEEESV
ncbi:MAG: cell division protein FtsZ [Gammaproteobacteria bacterium]